MTRCCATCIHWLRERNRCGLLPAEQLALPMLGYHGTQCRHWQARP